VAPATLLRLIGTALPLHSGKRSDDPAHALSAPHVAITKNTPIDLI
jgi:hypothetical protein